MPLIFIIDIYIILRIPLLDNVLMKVAENAKEGGQIDFKLL